METHSADRSLIRAGFTLFALALATGFAIPVFLNQKMALAAHMSGVMNGLILMAVGLAWGMLTLGARQATLTRRAFLFATYANWGTGCLAAFWGTSRLTPLSGANFGATAWKETVVQVLQISLALAIVGGTASVIYALRPRAASA